MNSSSFKSTKKYQDYLNQLVEYAHEDWLGFSVISPKVARIAEEGASFEDMLPIFRKLVSDLLDAGASLGDFASSPGLPFVAWAGTKEENLATMEIKLRELGEMPMSGDIGWIFFQQAKDEAKGE